MQKNWIGKSYGCEIKFKIESEKEIKEINVILLDQIPYLVCLF
jgi:leucyl-tRNA synthetase